MVKRILAIVIALLIPSVASANFILFFDPVNTFSGMPPSGSISVSISDVVGGADLTITSSLGLGENLDPDQTLFLGFNPAIDVTKLNFIGIAGFDTFGTFEGINNPGGGTHKADGTGGNFKLLLDNYPDESKPFTFGQSQTYFVSSVQASDFNFPNNAGLLGAIHVQDSGWVSATVPEPPSIVMASIGLIYITRYRFRKWWDSSSVEHSVLPTECRWFDSFSHHSKEDA